MATYNFYINLDGEVFGPYSATKIIEMGLKGQPDIYVAEESDSLRWRPYDAYDFEQMASYEDTPIPIPTPMSTPISSPAQRPMTTPTSNYASNSNVSTPDLDKFNWGALAFNWIWGCFNGVYWSLLILLLGFIPYAGGILVLGASIALGYNGNRLAWNAKKWDSVEHFNRVQHNWAVAALVGIVLTLAFIGSLFALFA